MMFSYDHNKSLGYLASLVSRLLSNILSTRFQEAGIDMTAEQWGAIIVLLNGEAVTQRELGEQLHLEKSSVSRLTDGLEKRGWIVRTRDPQDSRQKLVTPTPKVMETAEQCATIAREVLEKAHRGMSEEETVLCTSLLSRIIINLRQEDQESKA
nr:MarR family transcriptional regulator [uncultured Desulfuromonas sp.]